MLCGSVVFTSNKDVSIKLGDENRQIIFITVAKAVLTTNFDVIGKMDPYVIVYWKKGDSMVKIAHTAVDYNSHFHPIWNHKCKAQSYFPEDEDCSLIFKVYDKEQVSNDDFCGLCEVNVKDLLAKPSIHPYHELPFFRKRWKSFSRKNVQTGFLYVTATSLEGKFTERKSIGMTEVDPDLFITPVKRLGVSGGTAPFFSLELANPERGQNPHHYLGKDLDRSMDEVGFYEGLQGLQDKQNITSACLHGLLDYALPYAGVLTAREERVDGPVRKLIVMRNLRDGCEHLRLLDLKIGFKTADAGWAGKSWVRAMRQYMIVDKRTNTMLEGFRLEGFDGLPQSLFSLDPTLDGHLLMIAMSEERAGKKLRRRNYQQLKGPEIMSYLVDLHSNTFENITSEDEHLSKEEYAEVVLDEVFKRMARIALICHRVLIPQKWIGSSVAIGFDVGILPLRSEAREDVQNRVIVNLFDWGRSELNTFEANEKLDFSVLANYTQFWNSYVGGIFRLSWDVALSYYHRYGNSAGWEKFEVTIFDFDSMSTDDKLGKIELPAKACSGRYNVMRRRLSDFKAGYLDCSLEWVPYSSDSRISGVWRLFIDRARGLAKKDFMGKSDPYCLVKAFSDAGHESFQRTKVIFNDLNPVWQESFDFPVMRETNDSFASTLKDLGLSVNNDDIADLFTKGEDGYKEWVRRVETSQSAV